MSEVSIPLALLAIGLGLAGAAESRRGRNMAAAGHALRLESSTIEYQLAHDADHVLARVHLGIRMEDEGRSITLSGFRTARVGLACGIGALTLSALSIFGLI